MIEKFISNDSYKNKIIFDGYPRTLLQAKNLDDLLKKHQQYIEEELEKQVYAYNYYQAQPRQVAGTDVRVAPVTGNRENIV